MEALEKRHDVTDATIRNERLPPPIPDKKPPPHVMAINTKENTIFEFLEALRRDKAARITTKADKK